MPHTNIFDKIASYEFKDSIGHPLENCVEYIALRAELKKVKAERDVMAERIVDDNGEFFGGFDFEDAPAELSRAEAKDFVIKWAGQEAAKQGNDKL